MEKVRWFTEEEKDALRKFFQTNGAKKDHIEDAINIAVEIREAEQEIKASFPQREPAVLVGDIPLWQAKNQLEQLCKVKGKRLFRRLQKRLEQQGVI